MNVGEDQSRAHGIYPDAFTTDLLGKTQRHGINGTLGRGVVDKLTGSTQPGSCR